MMYRILNVRQIPGEDFKVWFTDDFWDLFIWVDSSKKISGFHLVYGKPIDERAVIWKRGGELTPMTVSSGEEKVTANRTPVMSTDPEFNRQFVIEKFREDCKRINKPIADFILAKLSAYAAA